MKRGLRSAAQRGLLGGLIVLASVSLFGQSHFDAPECNALLDEALGLLDRSVVLIDKQQATIAELKAELAKSTTRTGR